MRWVDWRQTETLADRYFSVLLGELGALLLLLLQAPFIGGVISIVWRGSRVDARLELFMCLAALWLGCMNACREIVKERAVYRRERMVFLQIRAYVLSKVLILAMLNAAQTIALLWIVHRYVGLSGNKAFLFGALFVTSLGGSMLGLSISAFVSSADKAVALVPLVVLPQILFSKPFLPGGSLKGLVNTLEKVMPLKWNYELYQEIVRMPKDPHYHELATALGASLLVVVLLYGLTCFILWFQES